MTRFWILLALVTGLQMRSHACLMFLEDKPHIVDFAPPPRMRDALEQHESRAVWEERARARQAIADKIWDFRSENNLTVALAHLGRLDEALNRMQALERRYPGQSATAFNLGTVYELKNDLPLAKFWIERGIKRELKNPGSTRLDGTEWLHVRILDAKIKEKLEPEELESQPVSGLDFGSGRVPVRPVSFPSGNDGQALPLDQVQRSLQEQLHERLEFSKAPDAIVGDLLFDFANTLQVRGDETNALDIYQLALTYQPAREGLAASRYNYYAGTPNYPLIALCASLALGGGGFYVVKRKDQQKKEWQSLPVQELDDLGPARTTVHIDLSNFEER